MPRRMRISRAGIELIKSFEGFSARTVRVDDEHWVIGYGHVRKSADQYRISRDEAEQVLREYDLPPFETLVLENTYTPLHQGAFDALVSFAFNIGKEAFLESDVLALLNAGEMIGAAEAMGAWRKSDIGGRLIIVDALVRRRAAEKAMFLSYPSGPAPAPSAILRPKLDVAAQIMVPRERAVVIETALDDEITGDEASRGSDEDRRTLRETEMPAQRDFARLTRRFEEALGRDEATKSGPVAIALPREESAPANDFGPGPTPEEITRAISELVNGGEAHDEVIEVDDDVPGIDIETGVNGSANDDDADYVLGEDVPEDGSHQKRFERTLGADVPEQDRPASDKPPLIDDLEAVEINPEDIERALRVHEQMQSGPGGQNIERWGPLALLSMFGAALCAAGIAVEAGADATGATTAITPGVFLIIFGALLFVVMSYYFFREFVASED